ncbi:MAG: Lrp/AsnC family transcriptional regulator [Hyphomonadaceae bacterium]
MTGRRPFWPPLYAPNGARLDDIDIALLRRLQTDSQVQNQALAQEVGLSQSGCLQRVRRLEESGVICGYVAVTEESVFASWSVLWIKVKLRGRAQKRRAEFESALRAAAEVMEAHEVAGRFDYLLKAALPSVGAWGALRARLDPEDVFIKSVDVLAGVRTAKGKGTHPLLASGESK